MANHIDNKQESSNVIPVPEFYYAIDVNYMTHMIADMLTRLTSHNDLIPLTTSNLTRFHSRSPPNISIGDYLRRIIKYTSVEKSCLLIILIYIDRICEQHPQFTVSSLTVHRFLITAITVSSKALCDSYCTNTHYAKVGGITAHELNTLELEFLALIDWHLAASGLVLQQYYVNLVDQHSCYERTVSPSVGASEQQQDDDESSLQRSRKRRKNTADSRKTIHPEKPADVPLELSDDEKTTRHFDELLDCDSIPYIA